jgi:hypothetical protein
VRVGHGMNPVIRPPQLVKWQVADEELAMRDGYVEVPVTSRAAQTELERQQARRRAAASPDTQEETSDSAKKTEPDAPIDAPAPLDS